jgi:GAF domain-containing protein
MSKETKTDNPQFQLNAAAEISKATTSILDTDELLQTAVKLIQEKLNLYYAGIFLLDNQGTTAVLQAGTGDIKPRKKKYPVADQTLIGQSIKNGQPQIANTTRDRILSKAKTEMVLPLTGRKAVIGALTIHSQITDAFSKQDQDILKIIADQLAIGIENTRLFANAATSQQVAEDLLHETIALQQLSQALSGTLSVEQIVEIFFQTCTKMLGFDFVIFSLVDESEQRVKAIAGAGVTQEHIKRANHPLDSKDIMADIIRTGHTEIIDGWDDRFDKTIYDTEQLSEWGLRVFTPIRLRRENIGLVEIGYNKNTQEEIHDSQIRLLRAFIDQTALAIDNARRHEASQRAIRREALIKEITTKVRASTNVDTILQTAVKEIGDALHGKRTYVHLVAPTNGHDIQD